MSKESILKGFKELDLIKSKKTGFYANTPENRKLGRVGQKYKREPKESEKKDIKAEFIEHEEGWTLTNPPQYLLDIFADQDAEDDKWIDPEFWDKEVEPLIKKYLGKDYERSPKDGAYLEDGKIELQG